MHCHAVYTNNYNIHIPFGTHMTPTSRSWLQSAVCGSNRHSRSFFSSPKQRVLSRNIGPVPDPYLAPGTTVAPENNDYKSTVLTKDTCTCMNN